MNVIVETSYWRNDSLGAAVQLMFPAIYTLSCKMNVLVFLYKYCKFLNLFFTINHFLLIKIFLKVFFWF